MIKPVACLVCLSSMFPSSHGAAQKGPAPSSVFIEELTWPEIKQAMVGGVTTAIVYTGSTEANGPHLVTGKHTIIARYVAGQIATALGDALVYPVLPFAPAHDPETRSGLMAFPGTVSLPDNTYGAVVRGVIVSALSVGFRHVVVMGDHGLGQDVLKQTAEALDTEWRAKGRSVSYIPAVYFAAADSIVDYLRSNQLPADGHAGIDDTAELMFIEARGGIAGRWVRGDRIAWADSTQFETKAVAGDPRPATAALGERFVGYKIQAGVSAIRRARATHPD